MNPPFFQKIRKRRLYRHSGDIRRGPTRRLQRPSVKPLVTSTDALTVAAKMLHDLEERGKEVTSGNIAYYTILHMKSGRRSYSADRTDVMNAGTQLDCNSMVLSFEEPAGYDPDTDEEIPLGDMLAASDDDPAGAAARMMDWEDFLDTHNPPLRGVRVRSRTGQTRQGYGRQIRVQRLVGHTTSRKTWPRICGSTLARMSLRTPCRLPRGAATSWWSTRRNGSPAAQ